MRAPAAQSVATTSAAGVHYAAGPKVRYRQWNFNRSHRPLPSRSNSGTIVKTDIQSGATHLTVAEVWIIKALSLAPGPWMQVPTYLSQTSTYSRIK